MRQREINLPAGRFISTLKNRTNRRFDYRRIGFSFLSLSFCTSNKRTKNEIENSTRRGSIERALKFQYIAGPIYVRSKVQSEFSNWKRIYNRSLQLLFRPGQLFIPRDRAFFLLKKTINDFARRNCNKPFLANSYISRRIIDFNLLAALVRS